MRQGKNPTRAQKGRLKSLRLDPRNWLIIRDCPTCFKIIHRVSKKVRTLNIQTREEQRIG